MRDIPQDKRPVFFNKSMLGRKTEKNTYTKMKVVLDVFVDTATKGDNGPDSRKSTMKRHL